MLDRIKRKLSLAWMVIRFYPERCSIMHNVMITKKEVNATSERSLVSDCTIVKIINQKYYKPRHYGVHV